MSAANALNAFMTTRQFRQGEDDRRQRNTLMQDASRTRQAGANVNALMMGGQEQDAPRYEGQAETNLSGMDKARGAAMQSGDADVMANFQQQVAALSAADREAAGRRLRTQRAVATALLDYPEAERLQWLRDNAAMVEAGGLTVEQVAQLPLTDQNLASHIQFAQGMDDELFASVTGPQTLGANETRLDPITGRQTIGQAGAEARAIDQYGADTGRMNADTNRINAGTAQNRLAHDMASADQGPAWVTLEADDPRRAGFDEGEVVQLNRETGQVSRRSVDRVFNATESQAAGFAGRMNDASSVIGSIEGSSAFQGVPEFIWSRPTRTLPEQWQQYRQAGENWIRANLRRESGAVIGADEMAAEFRVYLPQPGDSPAVISQKADARARAEQAMRAQSRGAYEEYGLDRSVDAPASPSQRGRQGQRSQSVQIMTGDDYAALPPGTRYIDPNGVERVKQ